MIPAARGTSAGVVAGIPPSFQERRVVVGEAWIIDTARTYRGIGKAGKGALSEIHPQHLLAAVLKALAERNAIDTRDVDDVIAGCGAQIGKQTACIARMSALQAGFDFDAPGVTLDRFCGSGLTSVNMGAMGVMSGMLDLVFAGGVEVMSLHPTMNMPSFVDSGNEELRRTIPQPHQGVCADTIATLEGFTREDVDKLALESQRRADIAIREGRFDRSTITVYNDDGSVALDREQFPRPQTTLEGLGQLKPSFAAIADFEIEGTTFRKMVQQVYPDLAINHVHHAGNSSGVVDGASSVIIASPEYARAHGLKPRARIVSIATAGDNPTLMLNAPAPAARKALAKAGMTMKDIDLIEINEAFATVPLKFMREMDVDPGIVNVNGGAMALGHPIGATGAIILGTLLDEMERRDLNVGMATLCAGGGMAPATIIERI
jgi:acetyl-CoA C-acetyltransferase